MSPARPWSSTAGWRFITGSRAHLNSLADLFGRGHRLEATFEISDQIARIFQSDMKTKGGAARRPFGSRPVFRTIEHDHQALEAAPGKAHAEQRQLVHQGVNRFFAGRLEHDAEQATGAGE